MQLEPVNILEIVFAFQASFGALLIANKRQYRGLVALLLSTALLMIFNLLEETGVTRDYRLVTPIFSLANGPLFYLFVRQLVFSKKPLKPSDWLHLTPALLSLPLTQWPQLVLFLGSISQVIYAVYCFRMVRRYHLGSMALRSDAYALQISWVNRLLATIIFIGLIDLIRSNLQPYLPIPLLKRIREKTLILSMSYRELSKMGFILTIMPSWK